MYEKFSIYGINTHTYRCNQLHNPSAHTAHRAINRGQSIHIIRQEDTYMYNSSRRALQVQGGQ